MEHDPKVVLSRPPWIALLIVCSIFNIGVARVIDGDPHLILPKFGINSTSTNLNQLNQLELDDEDCYYAPESTKGLACDKEGYFINSFQKWVWWEPGQLSSMPWVKVPASRALCCRPKVPDFPASLRKTDDDPVGIVSVGCHTSTNKGLGGMQCEVEGNSFVAGFVDSQTLNKAPNTFYPIDGIECCTPVVLMSSGDAWSIERCGCTLESKSISCKSPSSGSLLSGFEYSGETGGHTIPLAPAMCCKFCLGKQLHPLAECADLNRCHGNGVCILGSCMCKPGFTGPDCSAVYAPNDGHQPWYKSIWWLGIIGFAVALGGLFLTFWMSRQGISGDRSRQIDDHETPLMDPEGSAGSVDTRSDRSSHSLSLDILYMRPEEQPDDVHELGIETPASVGRENRPTSEDSDVPQSPLQSRATSTDPQVLESSDESEGDTSTPYQMNEDDEELQTFDDPGVDDTNEGQTQTVLNEPAQSSRASYTEEKVGEKQSLNADADPEANALKGMACSICFERPIQVALVPCGHSNLCRKCSRKLEHCPFCRKDIIRRQKLFITG